MSLTEGYEQSHGQAMLAGCHRLPLLTVYAPASQGLAGMGTRPYDSSSSRRRAQRKKHSAELGTEGQE